MRLRWRDKEHTCRLCDTKTDLVGFVWKAADENEPDADEYFDSMVKVDAPFCKPHYMQCMFGLTAWHCSAECMAARQKALGVVLRRDHGTVWINMVHLYCGQETPRCPWCGEAMMRGEPEESDDATT